MDESQQVRIALIFLNNSSSRKDNNEVNWEQEKKAALIAALNIIIYKNVI